jgi:hypothetical protein
MAAEYGGEIDVPESAIQIIDENVIGRGSALSYPYRVLRDCSWAGDSKHVYSVHYRASAWHQA